MPKSFREAKISKFYPPFRIYKDIGRLQVPMDNFIFVKVLKAKKYLYEKVHDELFLEVTFFKGFLLYVVLQISI